MRAQRLDLALEVGGRGERPVHRRKAQVGDFIEITQRTENRQADFITGHLG